MGLFPFKNTLSQRGAADAVVNRGVAVSNKLF